MPTLQVRNLPEHIYLKIVERARAKRSSITKETINLLEQSLAMNENRQEHKKALIKRMLQIKPADNDLFPDPVLMVREDRER
jgi:plasmid stability protein